MFESIVEIVADYAEKQPDKPCIADREGVYSYKEVWERTVMTAEKLKKLEIKKAACVMVDCTQDADFLICDLACELYGAIFVPVEHKASQDRILRIYEDTSAELFVCNRNCDIPVRTVSAKMLMQREPLSCTDQPLSFPRGEDTAEILYTTGTTGISKGIEMTNQNNVSLAENVKYGTEMKETNVELIPLPLSHSHGLRCCYANLLNGSTVVLTDGVSQVNSIFGLIEKYQITALDLSPSAVMILDKLSKGRFADISGQIDYIQVGTAVLQEDTKEMLVTYFPSSRLYNFYGSTESGRTCVLDFNKDRGKKGCIGRPSKNSTFMIVDESGKQIHSSRENMGYLASAGPMNMKGYWKQPELTARTMRDGYVYTKDVGYIDNEGYVYVLGRKDDIINYKGIKIAPEEIEEYVRKYSDITDCACIPRKDKLAGQIPVLFISVKDENNFHKKELFRFLEKYIDENKMPREVEIIDEIPRTSNGKIHRVKLIDRQNGL